MRRTGFTLVELTLSVALGSVILFMVWQLLGAGQRDAVATERRLAGVAAIQRVSQYLEADLARLCPHGEGGGIEIAERGRTLRFVMSATPAAEVEKGASPRAESFVYALDAAQHRLMRGKAGHLEPVPGVTLEDIVFARTATWSPKSEPTEGPLPAVDTVLVRVTWAPPEELSAKRVPRPEDRVVISMSFGLSRLSAPERYPFWIPAPLARHHLESR